MTKTKLFFTTVFVIVCAATLTKASSEVQFYRAEEFNLSFALPIHWETSEIPSQDNALLLGFHRPEDDEHSMILFSIPKEGSKEEDLIALYENAVSVFSGVREEDTVYEPLAIDGMPAIRMQEVGFFHSILFIDDDDRYIILVYRDPEIFDDMDYTDALETVQSSIGLLHNAQPYVANEKDYLVTPYQSGVQVIGYTGNDRRIRVPDHIGGKPVLSIGDSAFSELDIQHVSLPETVTRIEDHAFSTCLSLRSVSLPSQLLAIGEYSFELCEQLLFVSIPDSVVSIGGGAFIGCVRLREIQLPSALTFLGSASLAATNIAAVSIDSKNTFFKVSDNVLFSKDGKRLLYYPQGREDKQYQVPEGVETIGSFAFAQIDMMPYALEKVSLPSSLKRIGTGALSLLKQQNFVIPPGVNMIEPAAFSNETKITLYGEYGSDAERYAIANGFGFIDVREAQ